MLCAVTVRCGGPVPRTLEYKDTQIGFNYGLAGAVASEQKARDNKIPPGVPDSWIYF